MDDEVRMEEGFYWFTRKGGHPEVVRVENAQDYEPDGPWLYFTGQAGEEHLSEANGVLGERIVLRPRLPQPGDKRYSTFFGSNVTLRAYTDDYNWWFVVDNQPRGGEHHSRTQWSLLGPAR